MTQSKLVKAIISKINKKYKGIKIYAKESTDGEGIDIIINNKQIFNSNYYAKFIFCNTVLDKESGKFINFLYED
jgi:hypothetical protein